MTDAVSRTPMPDPALLKEYRDRVVVFAADRPATLSVVVDTEEEFDWSRPFSRDQVGVRSIPEQDHAHEIYDPLGVVPTYVIDYPVATDARAAGYLRALRDDGRCAIGAHLHPWVTPPFEEEVCARNSFHGNLPPSLEQRKLQVLTRAIEAGTGIRPSIFKAGRYGVGPNTFALLIAEGYSCDCSPVPYADFRAAGGPCFIGWPSRPFWVDRERRLLSVPLTRGFYGALAGLGPLAPALFESGWAQACRLPAILARLSLADRAWLSPEGVSIAGQMRLLRTLHRQGYREFQLTYHSPSLGLGHTPYVRDADDRKRLLDTIRQLLHFFRDEIGGRFSTLQALHREASRLAGAGESPAAPAPAGAAALQRSPLPPS